MRIFFKKLPVHFYNDFYYLSKVPIINEGGYNNSNSNLYCDSKHEISHWGPSVGPNATK